MVLARQTAKPPEIVQGEVSFSNPGKDCDPGKGFGFRQDAQVRSVEKSNFEVEGETARERRHN